MNVRQQIMIGSLRVNSISNSSVLQIGSAGLVQAYAKDTKEYYTVNESPPTQPGVNGKGTLAGEGAQTGGGDSPETNREF